MDAVLVDELKRICGAENVTDSPVDLNGYRYVHHFQRGVKCCQGFGFTSRIVD